MIVNIKEIIKDCDPIDNWSLPERSNEIEGKNLYDLLKDIPEFRQGLLPNSRWGITQINRYLKKNEFIQPSEVTKNRSLYSSIALAVDRGALAIKGVNVIHKPALFLRTFAEEDWATLLVKSTPSKEDYLSERYAVNWLYLLGRLEPVMRGFRPVSDLKIDKLPNELTVNKIKDWLLHVIPLEMSEELLELLNKVNDLHLEGTLFPNPIFGGFGLINGSDGDWISGDTLVELKCTVRGLKNLYISQLICYSALREIKKDNVSSDMPPVNNIAFCLPRQSTTIKGTVDDWLSAFGAPPKEIVFDAIETYFKT